MMEKIENNDMDKEEGMEDGRSGIKEDIGSKGIIGKKLVEEDLIGNMMDEEKLGKSEKKIGFEKGNEILMNDEEKLKLKVRK